MSPGGRLRATRRRTRRGRAGQRLEWKARRKNVCEKYQGPCLLDRRAVQRERYGVELASTAADGGGGAHWLGKGEEEDSSGRGLCRTAAVAFVAAHSQHARTAWVMASARVALPPDALGTPDEVCPPAGARPLCALVPRLAATVDPGVAAASRIPGTRTDRERTGLSCGESRQEHRGRSPRDLPGI